jgi:hypothetical protein
MNGRMPEYATKRGHLHVLKWLHETHRDVLLWNSNICAYGAKKGLLEVLKWTHANNCKSVDERVCSYASLNGDLAMLQWAYEKRFPWDNMTCAYAA